MNRLHFLALAGAILVCAGGGAVMRQIEAGKRPRGIAADPGGSRLYVANGRSDSVPVIDAASAARVATIPVDQPPWGVVIR
jgi:YVTN family beta-propeller protein